MENVANMNFNVSMNSKDLKLHRLHLDLSVKFGIDLKNRVKDQFLLARDNLKQSNVVMRIHNQEKDRGEPIVTIDGKETKALLDVATSGQYTFTRAAKEIDRISEAISKELLKGESRVYVAAVEGNKVKDAAVFELDKENKNIVISEINGRPSHDPSGKDQYNFVENTVRLFQKCVFMVKDEYERMKEIGEEVTISKERMDLGRELSPSLSIER
ncbi:MAG: hypothetical protein Q8934_08820 [Bacillota bacterium]|nr:hypothetical protein [Bacillota bacterium]